MFRPNRIGTPVIHTNTSNRNTSAWSPAMYAPGNANTGYNVINASPLQDFGRTALDWSGSAVAITGGYKYALGCQFTITQPLTGDVRGVELNGSINIDQPGNVNVTPIFMKMFAARSAVLEGDGYTWDPTYFSEPYNSPTPTDTTARIKTHTYRNQVIVQGNSTLLPGTYFHGFQFQDGGAGHSLTYFRAAFSVRQLNDQQNVGYADTLR